MRIKVVLGGLVVSVALFSSTASGQAWMSGCLETAGESKIPQRLPDGRSTATVYCRCALEEIKSRVTEQELLMGMLGAGGPATLPYRRADYRARFICSNYILRQLGGAEYTEQEWRETHAPPQ